jgi:hypothetical protein
LHPLSADVLRDLTELDSVDLAETVEVSLEGSPHPLLRLLLRDRT